MTKRKPDVAHVDVLTGDPAVFREGLRAVRRALAKVSAAVLDEAERLQDEYGTVEEAALNRAVWRRLEREDR